MLRWPCFAWMQEAVTNAMTHSAARQLSVSLDGNEDEIRLDVSDDGVGFDPDTAMKGHGLGLIGMRERLMAVGGNCAISSRFGAGTDPRPRPDSSARTPPHLRHHALEQRGPDWGTGGFSVSSRTAGSRCQGGDARVACAAFRLATGIAAPATNRLGQCQRDPGRIREPVRQGVSDPRDHPAVDVMPVHGAASGLLGRGPRHLAPRGVAADATRTPPAKAGSCT